MTFDRPRHIFGWALGTIVVLASGCGQLEKTIQPPIERSYEEEMVDRFGQPVKPPVRREPSPTEDPAEFLELKKKEFLGTWNKPCKNYYKKKEGFKNSDSWSMKVEEEEVTLVFDLYVQSNCQGKPSLSTEYVYEYELSGPIDYVEQILPPALGDATTVYTLPVNDALNFKRILKKAAHTAISEDQARDYNQKKLCGRKDWKAGSQYTDVKGCRNSDGNRLFAEIKEVAVALRKGKFHKAEENLPFEMERGSNTQFLGYDPFFFKEGEKDKNVRTVDIEKP